MAVAMAHFTPTAAGRYRVLVVAEDSAGNLRQADAIVIVSDPNDTVAPIVSLSAPEELAVVTSPTDIVGTVTDDSLVEWQLLIAPGDTLDASVCLAEGTTAFTEAVITRFDPSLDAQWHLSPHATRRWMPVVWRVRRV